MESKILGSAQGAVGSLLGRLTSALAEEAQLLSGVRGDVQFIKDEMESMNGFLLHVVEDGGDEDHQVQAWMKQVAEVAYASQNCVDLYIRSLGAGTGAAAGQGLLGYLRRLPRFLWTLPARHRIGTQIQQLKIRTREVGERRLRYGVEAPLSRGHGGRSKASTVSWQPTGDDDAKEQEEVARRRALAGAEPLSFERFALIKWMTRKQDHGRRQMHAAPAPRVIALWGYDEKGRTQFAKSVYNDPWLASSCSLDYKAWIEAGSVSHSNLLRDILVNLGTPANKQTRNCANDEQLVKMIQLQLKGKSFFIVLHNLWDKSLWDCIKPAFRAANCSLGSAILVVTTWSRDVVHSFSPYEIYDTDRLESHCLDYLTNFYSDKAISLVNNSHQTTHLKPVLRAVFAKLAKDHECIRLFLDALYVNPNSSLEDFRSLRDNLKSPSSNHKKQIQMFQYNGLSSNCKNCLLYLSIFPEKTTIRRTRLVRRWVAEGMVTKRGKRTLLEEANSCFDVLLGHGFVLAKDTDATGKVKSCIVPDLIHDLATEIARDKNFVNANLPPDLAHRLAISNTIQLQQAMQKLHASRSKACWNTCNHFNRGYQMEVDESNLTIVFLESLPLSNHLGLLEVLDLEDCKGLMDHHLKNICSHVFQLKYLSLRNTDITKLPKQIDKLRYLETLDIRQTKVRAFAKRTGVLPKLKCLLAGQQNDSRSQRSSTQSEEPFLTVQMPKSVRTMTELQVLSHFAVSENASELIKIGNLLQLRKLGLVLHAPQGRAFRHLYHAIGKLSRSLRTLSIRIVSNSNNADMFSSMEERLLIPPKCLQKLEISGLANGLPPWVKDLRELTKITLHKTLLTTADIEILGKLTSLFYLWLQQESCIERTVTFKKDEFQSLKFLVIECSDITNIKFADGATSNLKRIVWFSTGSQALSLSGIEFLQSLKELKLTGNFDLKKVEETVSANRNNPTLKTS